MKNGGLWQNAITLGIGSALSKLVVFLMLPLYTAVLTPAEFGTVDVLVGTAAFLIPLVSLGAPEAYFRFVAGGESERGVARVCRTLLFAGASVLLLALPIMTLIPILRPFLPFLLFYVVFSVLHSMQAHRLRARGDYLATAIQQLFCTLATVLLACLFLSVLGLGVKGYLLAILLADGITAAVLFFYLRATALASIPPSALTLTRPVLRYALPLVPTALLWWMLTYFDRYVLLATHGESAVGVYAAAGKIPALLTFATSVFMEAWHFSAIHVSKEGRQALFGRIYGALLPFLLAIVSALVLLARPTVKILFASDFEAAAPFVPILALSALFTALSSFLGSIYVVKFRSGSALASTALAVLVNFALDFWLIPRFGAFGAALATLGASFLLFFARSTHARRIMPFDQHALPLFLALVALTAATALSLVESRLAFLLAPFIFLPFWREIREIFRFASKMLQMFRQKATKSKKIP